MLLDGLSVALRLSVLSSSINNTSVEVVLNTSKEKWKEKKVLYGKIVIERWWNCQIVSSKSHPSLSFHYQYINWDHHSLTEMSLKFDDYILQYNFQKSVNNTAFHILRYGYAMLQQSTTLNYILNMEIISEPYLGTDSYV